ncbi:MAG: hypothetical protein U5L95_01445 [Candidatus Saccharibacteria bacterium]|nr:hypothetical protein [Candidatus Saccharibacteria bacterium]
MNKFEIPVETPKSIAEIDFEKLHDRFGAPIDVFTDVEGTLCPWKFMSGGDAKLDRASIDAFASAANDGHLRGVHAITNRSGDGGAMIAGLVSAAINISIEGVESLYAYPQKRSERKPSGVMSARILENLITIRGINPGKKDESLAVAFIGDKPSDIQEAQLMHNDFGFPVVGFMVPRLGGSDHPLDRLFGKRMSANSVREQLSSTALKRYIKEEV